MAVKTIDVGGPVYNHYHGFRRYGIVESKRIDNDGWAYFKVKWFQDEDYQAALAYRQELTHKNYGLTEYRKDKLVGISLDKELSILSDIKAEIDLRKDTSKS
tara:strand:+ start:25 stop:330 length:306 start_codon:yes stop_codon:yes gene_type:complete